MHKVFVYGTLLPDPHKTPWKMLNLQIAARWGNSGYPISRKLNDAVTYGDIIEVDDEKLRNLDRYEGAPNLYTREQGIVIGQDGERVNVYYYLYAGKKDDDFWNQHAVERWVDGINV